MSALDELKKLLEEAHLHRLKPETAVEEKVKPKVGANAIAEFKEITNKQSQAISELDEDSQELSEKDIVQMTADLLNKSNSSNNIPAAPQDIEAQRWNDPLRNTNFVTQEQMNNHYKLLLQRIQTQLSTVGGGGEVKLRMLDDVDRSTIADGLFLKYQASTRKFVFSSQEHEETQVNTAIVTSSTYELNSTDSYVGVNYAGGVTITLPSVDVANGRLVYLKDESGAAETNPITVLGTVDNDAGGFTLQINNGSITLIYREGWRIV